MFESIQFLLRDLTKKEKLYLARLLNRDGFTVHQPCSDAVCHLCTIEPFECVCSCHLE